ncbi:glycoside hydrolase family 3 N-terminal domain-containing protein [uncultured Tessaracoccus sp.]|uniref:glycoside hydrolase family 3 N-terminal domain-containing protein n=1 Tax=uncultured Tessaracoccus sp. TaxID=905023 RepID=UPI00260B68E1|nr:glycoside hydrolase family 3 N-terminal domain-containing protein [uncultured Tessaracoccus sp.]
MSLQEKVGQMLQLDARGDVEALVHDWHVGSILHTSPEKVLRAQAAVKQTRLGIPLLVAEDVIHGHSFWEGATIFPTQLGMAASWAPGLVRRSAAIAAMEARATGIHWTFSPVLCIARDLRWGRVNETFGEDPFLIGELASAMVAGYQGEGGSSGIMATAKHFAGYSETQGGRDASEADISRRKLESWFLPPFERVAKEGCATFMLGYQTMDGVPITINEWLLTDVLRDKWGYRGALVTDWDNVGRMVWEQKVQPDHAHAAAAAIRAGNDVIMTTPQFFQGAQDAVDLGLVDEELIDQAVRRILTLKFRRGLFEDAGEPDASAQRSIGSAEHARVNLEIARRSLVLLRNEDILPLDNTPLRIAVVGPLADDAQTQLGDWAGSSGQIDWMPNGHPREMIATALDGLREQAPEGVEVSYAKGAEIVISEPDPRGAFPDGQPRMPIAVSAPIDEAQLGEAVKLAERSDVIVAVVGDCIELVGEARSTATLELLGGQHALLQALAATGKPLIIVMVASKPLIIPEDVRHDAFIWAANPGMRGGQAIAELIYGQIEPSGRLPISFARHAGQQPTYYNQIRGQHGDRYADLTQEPTYVFGEGLAYTEFAYSCLKLETAELAADGELRASVEVTNTGHRPGLETVQLYIRDLVTSVSWVDKELKAFQQIELQPGETRRVHLVLPVSQCTIVNAAGDRVVEPGEFEVLIGHSSRTEDLLAASFTVTESV